MVDRVKKSDYSIVQADRRYDGVMDLQLLPAVEAVSLASNNPDELKILLGQMHDERQAAA